MSGAANQNISVKIGFDDKALGRIPQASKKLGKLETDANRAGRGIQTLAEQGNLTKLTKGMHGLASEGLKAFENLGRIMGPLEVITGAASLAGLAKLTASWGDMTTQLGYSAQRAGAGVQQLSALQGAARMVGVSAQTVTTGLTGLSDTLTATASGRAPEAAAAFNYLGVSIRGANGHLLSATQILPQLADKIAGIKNPALQARLATELFGGAGDDLLPFLRQGAAGIANLTTEAQSYGTTSQKDVDIANKFTHSQGELQDAIGGLGNALGEKYLPSLTAAEHGLAQFIAANHSAIVDGIGAFTTALTAFSVWLGTKWLAGIGKTLGSDLAAVLGNIPKLLAGDLALPLLALGLTLTPNTSIQNQSDEEKALKAAIDAENVRRKAAGLPPLPEPMGQPSSLSQTVYNTDEEATGAGKPGSPAHPYSPIAETKLPDIAKAFLNTLAGGESGGDYARMYGSQPDFTSFADHPRKETQLPNGQQTSAAGRYQFEAGTWDAEQKKLGLPDFGPKSQDIAAWDLAQQTYAAQTGRDLKSDLQLHDPKIDAGIKQALAATWPSIVSDNLEPKPGPPPGWHPLSLPSRPSEPAAPSHQGIPAVPAPAAPAVAEGGTPGFKQAESNYKAAEAAYDKAMAGIHQPAAEHPEHPREYRSALTGEMVPFNDQPDGAPATVNGGTGSSPSTAGETTVKGAATVTVNLNGAPPGTKASATSSGDLFNSSGPPRVQQSGVGQGMPS